MSLYLQEESQMKEGSLQIRVVLSIPGGWGVTGAKQHIRLPPSLFSDNVVIDYIHIYGHVETWFGQSYEILFNGIPVKICKNYSPHDLHLAEDNFLEVKITAPIPLYWIGPQTVVLTIEIHYYVFGSSDQIQKTFNEISKQAKEIEITINQQNREQGNPSKVQYTNVWGIFANILQWLPMILLFIFIFYLLSWLPRPRR